MKHMKTFVLLAAAALVVAWSFTARAQTTIPTLKAETAVTSDLVRIGDILTNAGEQAGQPIFRAPELGSSGTIQVHRVMEALRAHGIIVFDTRNLTEVLITRETYAYPGTGRRDPFISLMNTEELRPLLEDESRHQPPR